MFDKVKNNCVSIVEEIYKNETASFKSKKEGKTRKFSENLIEKIVQAILECISYYAGVDIISKFGDNDKLQYQLGSKRCGFKVDRHNYVGGRLFNIIENKSNLDAAYFKRALTDCICISRYLVQNNIPISNVNAAIVAGEQSIKNDTYDVLKETIYDGYNGEKLHVETFYLFNEKRHQKRGKELFNGNDTVNKEGVSSFVDYILSKIEPKNSKECIEKMEDFTIHDCKSIIINVPKCRKIVGKLGRPCGWRKPDEKYFEQYSDLIKDILSSEFSIRKLSKKHCVSIGTVRKLIKMVSMKKNVA